MHTASDLHLRVSEGSLGQRPAWVAEHGVQIPPHFTNRLFSRASVPNQEAGAHLTPLNISAQMSTLLLKTGIVVFTNESPAVLSRAEPRCCKSAHQHCCPYFFLCFFLWDLMLHQISVSKHIFAHVSLTFITHLYNLPSFFLFFFFLFFFQRNTRT